MGIRSIERAFKVLQEMNLQPHSSIARLHEKTGLPKPTLVRILKTLEEAGYVENDKDPRPRRPCVLQCLRGPHAPPCQAPTGLALPLPLLLPQPLPLLPL